MLIFAMKNNKNRQIFKEKSVRQYDNIGKDFDAENQDLAIFSCKNGLSVFKFTYICQMPSIFSTP